jgi:hypothetical protein
MTGTIAIEPTGSSDTGVCDCCGNSSRCVWGEAYVNGRCTAVYFVHWTLDHVPEHGASIELIIGDWGDGTTAQNRIAIALAYRLMEGIPTMMVIDAGARPVARSPLAGQALRRDDVIGTPLAPNVFSIADAVLAQDHRVGELLGR